MKKLYNFTLSKEIEVKETVNEKNEKGEEISVTKTVKKQIQQDYYLMKLNYFMELDYPKELKLDY